MKNIQIQALKIEILQQQSAIFSGNNIQYKSFLKKERKQRFWQCNRYCKSFVSPIMHSKKF